MTDHRAAIRAIITHEAGAREDWGPSDHKVVDMVDSMAREVETLERHNRAFRDANTSLDKRLHEVRDLMHRLGAAVVLVSDGIEDEGGRCVLYSTNHAEVLNGAKRLYDEYREETGEMGPEDALVADSN